MSYTEWREWALGNDADSPDENVETWRRVAENADCDARYENPDVQPETYRNALGERHPTTEEQFNDVCRNPDHQLTGDSVDGTIPDHLARCVSRQAVETQVNERIEIEERAGRNFRQTSSENHDFDLSDVPASEWRVAAAVLPDPVDDLYLSDFRSNRVFATLGEREADADGDSPTFHDHLQTVQRPKHSLAEEAVYRLALASSPEFP